MQGVIFLVALLRLTPENDDRENVQEIRCFIQIKCNGFTVKKKFNS